MVKKFTIVDFLKNDEQAIEVSPLIKNKYGYLISKLKNKKEEFISAVELADFLHIKRQTVWNWIRKNNIPYVRIGKIYAVPIRELVRTYGRD